MGGEEWGWRPGGGAGRVKGQSRWYAPQTMTGSLECGGCGHPGGRGVVVMGGEAEQMGWGHVDFILNADLF